MKRSRAAQRGAPTRLGARRNLAGCAAGNVERRLVMTGVRLPKEGGLVGTIFPPASFGNLLLMGLVILNGMGRYFSRFVR
jgi:hypothetical protein